MNIIFLTLAKISDIECRGIYADLMRKFRDEGHQVCIVSPNERRNGQGTSLVEENGVKMLYVKTLNIQKTNILEKGIGTLLIERQYIQAIREYFDDVDFDLIAYSTPPITFANVVKYLKKKTPKAISYLLLKDIFPQNAVDIGLFGKNSLLYWFFRRKEKALYKVSDYIGCMSPANVKYVSDNNPEICVGRLEVAPNSIELNQKSLDMERSESLRSFIKKKYNLPMDLPIFVYGGTFGKPQGIDYLIKCLDENKLRKDCFFVMVGSGTHFDLVYDWYEKNKDKNVKVINSIPRQEYDMFIKACDVGLIFLDHSFTIPNYPSRLLGYLENKMPVICATDISTDIGKIAEENGYGYWCESVEPSDFTALVDKMLISDRKAMGERGFQFLKNNYLVDHTYNTIMKHFL